MRVLSIIFLFSSLSVFGQGTFAPPAGQVGTTAIFKDSSAIIAWATQCEVTRGYADISDPGIGPATFGVEADALGPSNPSVVSLGDSGIAYIGFDGILFDGPGPDFAIFENSFSDDFLELAFVEVSSDGVNFFRFPATSTTPDTAQVDGFGSVDATHLNNLAGKYRALFGTPFDLAELSGVSGLDINNITKIKIVDCVGSINPLYGTYDHLGNIINDPFPTPFPSSGFDLDAVGLINFTPSTNVEELEMKLSIYPNPVKDRLSVAGARFSMFQVFDLQGRVLLETSQDELDVSGLQTGQYILVAQHDSGTVSQVFVKY